MTVNSSRKRYLSLPAVRESEVKKIQRAINSKLNEDSCKDESTVSIERHGTDGHRWERSDFAECCSRQKKLA